jgi:putative endonuclease
MAPAGAARPTGAPHLERGRAGEDAALADFLARGYRLVARNWRCRLGEIDLVLERGPVLVVCEVKTRWGSAFGGPHESVTARKRAKLRALAEAFLAGSGARPAQVRFDVASVSVSTAGRPSVHVFEDAF